MPDHPLSTVDVHAQLIQLLERQHPRLAEVLALGAVPRWLDRERLIALRGLEDGREERLLARLLRFSFVNQVVGSDGSEGLRLEYTREMRRAFREHWLSRDPEGFAEANRRLVQYLDRWLATHPEPGPRRQEMELDRIYHGLAADPAAGLDELLARFDRVMVERHAAAAEQLLAILREQRDLLPVEAQAVVAYLRAQVDQLHDRWERAAQRLEPLLERTDLPPWLRVRVRRGLARTAMAMERWVEGIHLLEDALAIAQVNHLPDQAAWICKDLGDVHHDFARYAWAEPWAGPMDGRSPVRSVAHWASLAARLPLVLYLVVQMGIRPLVSGFHRVGRDMDWAVARLFATAARWYHQAESRFTALEDAQGLVALREARSWMWLNLDHPTWAEKGYRWLLEQDQVPLDPYRRARAQLELANALLRRKRPEEAWPLLEAALPVFQRYGHGRRVAQTHHLQARIRACQGDLAQATALYAQTLQAWQEMDDPVAATDVAHEMESLAHRSDLASAAREALLVAAGDLVRRVYVARYVHPFTRRLAQGAVLALAALLFVILMWGFRTQTGTVVAADAALVRPIQQEIPVAEELSPSISLSISQQIRPVVDLRIVRPLVVGGLLGYLILYTAAGLWVIFRMPLVDVERSQQRRLVCHPEQGIEAWQGATRLQRLEWPAVLAWVVSDRRIWRTPWPLHSYFALLGDTSRVLVQGVTRHYRALQARVQALLPPDLPRFDLGFQVLGSRSGWLFLLSLLYFGIFLALARWAPTSLLRPLDPFPYALVDLFGLAYLGVAGPLVYWFVVQPVRAWLAQEPDTPVVWLLGGAGGLLGVLYMAQHRWLQLPLGRPDIGVGLVALTGLGLTGWAVFRAGRGTHLARDLGYPLWVRIATLAAVGGFGLLLLWTMAREVLSFHWLAVGNAAVIRAERFEPEDQPLPSAPESPLQVQVLPASPEPSEVEVLYREAAQAYARSLELRPDPDVYVRWGNVLAQLGEFSDAAAAYRQALAQDPDDPVTHSNLALTYLDWAETVDDVARRERLYEQAWQAFTRALEALGPVDSRDRPLIETVHLLRGGAAFQRGADYLEQDRTEQALEWYRTAAQDYTWVIDQGLDPRRRAGAFAGRGWVRFWRGRLEAQDLEQEREFYGQALADFQAALDLNPDEISAYIGQGWTLYYLGLTYPACVAQGPDPPGAEERGRLFEQASQAYAQAIRLQPQAAIHYRVKAQLDWLVKNCPGYDYVTWLRRAIQDYEEAIRRDPTRAHWYFRQGNMYLDLAGQLEDPDAVRQAYQEAVEDYLAALELNPTHPQYWANLRFALGRLGWDFQETVQAWVEDLAGKRPERAVDVLYALGRAEFDAGRWEAAIPWLSWAEELAPTDLRPVWLLAWTYFVLGADEKALVYGERFAARVTPEFEAWTDRYYLLARIHERLDQGDQAVRYALQAIPEVPSLAHLRHLARILRRYGDGTGLVQLGLRAQELAPDDPRGHLWQGLGLAIQGAEEEARSRYRRAVQVAQEMDSREAARRMLDQARADLQAAVDAGYVDPGVAEALRAVLQAGEAP